MIAVIADDLTGAAELGGIGLRFGLAVEICLVAEPSSAAALLIIAADTRSKTEPEAVDTMAKLTSKIALLHPKLIYKKVDSVLRGHVLPELSAQLKVLQLAATFLIPANPLLGRTIENGSYLIGGAPIDTTSFKNDPEFPVKSADVISMLAVKDIRVIVKKHGEETSGPGIVVGEAASVADMKKWALSLKHDCFIAGGAGLFAELLPVLNIEKALEKDVSRPFSGKKLYISGTAFASSSARITRLASYNGLVNYLPQKVLSANCEQTDIENFAEHVSRQLRSNSAAVIAIDPHSKSDITAPQLRERMALVTSQVLQHERVSELIIEGGSTAASVLNKMGIRTLFPTNEYAPGVIRSRAGSNQNLYITLKPGSYDWPSEVWAF